MGNIAVQFRYLTGLKRQIFRNARLCGTWDSQGKSSTQWTERPMQAILAEDGCPAFTATVQFDDSEIGRGFEWGVKLDTPTTPNLWGIPTEVNAADNMDRVRSFQLQRSRKTQDFYFTYARRFGARKAFKKGRLAPAALRFAVWAPNAQEVSVVFGAPSRGYIADDGDGIDPKRPVFRMTKDDEGVWESDIIPDFHEYEGLPYMYQVKNAQGKVVYRTDLYSREQLGQGDVDPAGAHWDKEPTTLDGSKGCSLIVSLDTVAQDFQASDRGTPVRIPEAEFWATEFTPGLPVPSRFQDMVIYELHVGGLGAGKSGPGTLEDAMALLPYLSDLGVNAVELLPLAEFSGVGWGYGDSHYYVVESSAGGRDQYKHFVRECHRRGLAVIQDVVYNHYDYSALRAEWTYDSEAPEQNTYYWYEGRPLDYPSADGGYVDNGSSGFSPRFWEEKVRHLFVSSAAAMMEDCHVDGFRVDLTQAMHRDNRLHADGRSLGNANQFGAKTLREWSRTLRMIRPSAMLIAEDHSGWDKVTQLPELGGLGFDATWAADFYHNLIGDADAANGQARLLKAAGFGDDRALNMDQFAGVLYSSKYNKVVYSESHDEAGNDPGSSRTLACAVNGAPLVGDTRRYAEARARVAFGLSLFSAGTPMFFMGEEVGAQKPYTYDHFIDDRDDLIAERAGNGANLFRFYQDAIRFSRRHLSVRVQQVDIVHVNNQGRVIAWRRSSGTDELLVMASFNNHTFGEYVIQSDSGRLPDGSWLEVFNSDATLYGGSNFGNSGAALPVTDGRIALALPPNALIILARQ